MNQALSDTPKQAIKDDISETKEFEETPKIKHKRNRSMEPISPNHNKGGKLSTRRRSLFAERRKYAIILIF